MQSPAAQVSCKLLINTLNDQSPMFTFNPSKKQKQKQTNKKKKKNKV